MRYLYAADFQAALQTLTEGSEAAAAKQDTRWELAFLIGIGNTQNATYRYRDSIATLQRAAGVAQSIAKHDSVSAIACILANVYMRMGHRDLALTEVTRALKEIPSDSPPQLRAQPMLVLAGLKAEAGDWGAGRDLFRSALDLAQLSGQAVVIADGWNRFGYHAWAARDLKVAEHALNESFRIRRMNQTAGPVETTLRNLAMVKLAQGNPGEARILLDRALESLAARPYPLPAWTFFHQRALAHRDLGDLNAALADLNRCLESAYAWARRPRTRGRGPELRRRHPQGHVFRLHRSRDGTPQEDREA